MSTTIAPENIETDEPAALSEIDAAPALQRAAEERLDELSITTPLVRPIPRPPLVDAESRLIWPYIIAITLFHLLIPLAFLPYFFSWW
ncbi:MAG TPA: hypothetical protein VGM76_07625, partial [Lacipirellulaceae bacterium]